MGNAHMEATINEALAADQAGAYTERTLRRSCWPASRKGTPSYFSAVDCMHQVSFNTFDQKQFQNALYLCHHLRANGTEDNENRL